MAVSYTHLSLIDGRHIKSPAYFISLQNREIKGKISRKHFCGVMHLSLFNGRSDTGGGDGRALIIFGRGNAKFDALLLTKLF